MAGHLVPTFTRDKISVHDRILECMESFMSREDIVNHISLKFQTNRIWINTVFDKLELDYPDHFKSYYESLSFAQQSFNSEPNSQLDSAAQNIHGASPFPPDAGMLMFAVDSAAQNIHGASPFPPDAGNSNANPLQTPLYLVDAAAQTLPGASSSSQPPPEASDGVIEILKQMLSRLDQSLTKQDQSLTKQDQMLSKQDQMLAKQDQMLAKQDQMLTSLTRKRDRTEQDQDEVPDPRRQRTSDSA